MATDPEETPESALPTMARALGYLCLEAAEKRDAPLAESAGFLARLGFSRADSARIIGTSAESIRVTLAAAKKKGAQRQGGRPTAKANGTKR